MCFQVDDRYNAYKFDFKCLVRVFVKFMFFFCSKSSSISQSEQTYTSRAVVSFFFVLVWPGAFIFGEF